MRHDIGFFDTGVGTVRSYGYNETKKRHDESSVVVTVAGGLSMVIAIIIFLIAVLEEHSFTGVVVSNVFFWWPVPVFLLYLTHRNWGLDAHATRAMDAIYSLPKSEREEYGVKREDVKLLTEGQVDNLVATIKTYKRNLARHGSVGNLIDAMKQFNETVEEMRQTEKDGE